jgi:hypothetical protein
MAINGEVPAKQLLAVEYKPLGAAHLHLVINKAHTCTGPLHTHSPPSYLPTDSPTHLLTYPPTHLPTYLPNLATSQLPKTMFQ